MMGAILDNLSTLDPSALFASFSEPSASISYTDTVLQAEISYRANCVVIQGQKLLAETTIGIDRFWMFVLPMNKISSSCIIANIPHPLSK